MGDIGAQCSVESKGSALSAPSHHQCYVLGEAFVFDGWEGYLYIIFPGFTALVHERARRGAMEISKHGWMVVSQRDILDGWGWVMAVCV